MHIIMTFDDIIGLVLLGILILIVVIAIIKNCLDNFLYKIGIYKNCHNCKYYKLKNSTSSGNTNWYECTKKNRIDELDYNTTTVYKVCMKYKKQEENDE